MLRNPNFCDFSGGSGPPVPHSGSAHDNIYQNVVTEWFWAISVNSGSKVLNTFSLATQLSMKKLSAYLGFKENAAAQYCLHRGSYMSAHVLLNLLNELRKRDKMRGLSSILSLFCNKFKKFIYKSTNVRFYLSYD